MARRRRVGRPDVAYGVWVHTAYALSGAGHGDQQRHLEHNTGAQLRANFVDLGRAPIVGLVEPGWELRRLAAELDGLDELMEVP